MPRSISLRNYPLHIDQIEELGLPAHEYASAMADALAFLLWDAGIDACDVEFVLARPRAHDGDGPTTTEEAGFGTKTFTPGELGPHELWVLDFDCCRPLRMTGEGIKDAVERFWRNDPYYPNPDTKCAEDVKLWETFRDRFLETSGRIMASKAEEEREGMRQLPEQFIARVVETIGMYSKGVPMLRPSGTWCQGYC
ncbi:zinc finger protein-domain-containing protein [Cercophora newfieldiana]|uniref:Zinc finger protein-domain-containing protein n=1 Tax=Cercophora newfieldiana TaxID=92897 RepID=A0AA40CZH4_9PEZI|nr:zinc finger protein-domain-containing protein [Cercophora newfieldiana]